MSEEFDKELRQAAIDLLQAINAKHQRAYKRVIPNMTSAVKHINKATKLYKSIK